jgi:hypothetical protein
MTVVKISSPSQCGHDKTSGAALVPGEIVQSMIRDVGLYHVNDARSLLNSRFKGNFSDIVHEIRTE